MNDISPGLRARVLLEKHGFQTAHALGQNFLLDENLLSHLIDLAGRIHGDDHRLGLRQAQLVEQVRTGGIDGLIKSLKDKNKQLETTVQAKK